MQVAQCMSLFYCSQFSRPLFFFYCSRFSPVVSPPSTRFSLFLSLRFNFRPPFSISTSLIVTSLPRFSLPLYFSLNPPPPPSLTTLRRFKRNSHFWLKSTKSCERALQERLTDSKRKNSLMGLGLIRLHSTICNLSVYYKKEIYVIFCFSSQRCWLLCDLFIFYFGQPKKGWRGESEDVRKWIGTFWRVSGHENQSAIKSLILLFIFNEEYDSEEESWIKSNHCLEPSLPSMATARETMFGPRSAGTSTDPWDICHKKNTFVWF